MSASVVRLAAILVLGLLQSCRCTVTCGVESSGGGLSPADREAIASNTAAWLKAVRSADWTGVAETYTGDAMLLPPNQPAVEGRERIREWFAAFPPIVSMEIEDLEMDGGCGVAFVRGSYRFAIAPPGAGTITETGKYIEIRRRQDDGRWLKLRDMFSSDEPAPQ